MGASGSLVKQPETTVLFDGVCNLCSGAVQFIIKRDPSANIKFASLQSPYGQQQLLQAGLNRESLQTIIFIDGDKVYQRSDAALQVARKLTGGWPLLYGFILVPRFIRDGVYDLIARYRYRWFGKKEACW